MNDGPQDIPNSLTLADILAKVKRADYIVMPDSTTTVCQLRLENGYTVIGQSACVDQRKFNKAMGEQYAYNDALDKVWELEGYLLKQRRFEAGLN
jgi:hypothetical protein